MEKEPDFLSGYIKEAKSLLKQGFVREPVFSRGTYQVEIQEKGKKKTFPFLQMQDDGSVSDSFCTCSISEEGKGCPHVAAAYLRIFNGFDQPLHVRFRRSLWNRLCQMGARRQGYETDCLQKEGDHAYSCESKTKKRLFFIEALNAGGKKRLEEILAERAPETEETSIKFSNWSAEEMAQYRAGKGSHNFRFELSFWSDIAKWLMYLADEKKPYKIRYLGKPVPNEISIEFAEVKVWFYISQVSWPWLIPTLSSVDSPLKVFETEDEEIEKIEYDEESRSLQITHKGSRPEHRKERQGTPLGEWLFVEGKGFYRGRNNPIFQSDVIGEEKIAESLTQSGAALQKFLPIHLEPRGAQYTLHLDSDASFHIEMYVFEPGDLRGKAACFVPWVYIPNKGFYLIQDWLFPEGNRSIPRENVADFVNRHRLWLHNYPGFQTHLGSLESHLIYRLTEEGDLAFDAELNFPQDYEETYHFDEWVYIRGQGFYMKRENQGRLPLHPGLKVAKADISSFIQNHKDELEQVQGFFSSASPLAKTGLRIGLNEEGLIALTPEREFEAGIDPKQMQFFGSYVYVEGRGFSEISAAVRLPEKYQEATVISPSQEAAFLAYELEPLKPYILSLDPRLQKPVDLDLKIRRITVGRKKKPQEWLVDLTYQSESGSIDPFSIWDAFQERRRHLFSPAGLLSLKDARFNWIRQLPKKRLDRKRGLIRLTTLEWMRLNVFEEIEEPKGSDEESKETRQLLLELSRLETSRLIDISKLKAELRPYQEAGLHWLWFLYCHGLSGLLCDDMGLGKTHQTMALLAAVLHEDPEKRNKYLVVCPTSVIYHWQELLKRFLPDVRTCTYYGLERSLEDFETNYDLLLTSYGILRTGRENLRSYSFELAIFDEVQIAKNHASQTHQALRALNAKMRLGLTGTPIENRLRELKALFDVVLPSYMPPDALFRELFIAPIEKFGDAEKKALLGKLVKPFILRRKKSEVLTDLPEKIEEISYCDLSNDQRKLYVEVVSQMKSTVYQELKSEVGPVPYMHVFAALTQLKRICDHPALIDGDIKHYASKASGKWDLFTELLQEALGSGQKVVIFSQYLEMISIIEQYLKKKGIGYASIKGSTRDRSSQLTRFREDPKCEVFVASLLAAGVGIDLTVASIVIHYDRWWNPAKENQATDRVHRIGQNRGVQVFKLVTKNTIEEHIHDLIERKKGLLEQIIGADDQINYLSREELIQVFDLMFKETGL
jgi:superfamily II DNA or RNA helicase